MRNALITRWAPLSLPLSLRPESKEKLHCLWARVTRSLYHRQEPFAAQFSKIPAVPDSVPSTLKNSKTDCWEQTGANVELRLRVQNQFPRLKSKCIGVLQPPVQYEDVHTNPDQDCCLLQVTTLNFIFIPIVMGMIFTLVSGDRVSTQLWHRLERRLGFREICKFNLWRRNL